MRVFRDDAGVTWVASVRERVGDDYKGRFRFVMAPEDEDSGEEMELEEVRWNSLKTAERTLKTMSVSELKRRHNSAKARVG